MDKEKIIGLARNIFPDIKPIRDDLYRGELKISGKAAGIYYVDVSGQVPFDKFNEYQEKLLADEYYNNPGNLQWNLYLLLLQDEVNPEAKEKIERNEKYARKYIFNESQFEDFFKLEKSDAVVSSNVVLQWKEALKKVDLQEVYSKAKYTEAVDRFLNNQTKKITITESYSETTDVTKINFINQITLKQTYREHPREPRVFRFGKVNLIKGINGVGKTCLLESVELVACGRTFRNSDKKESDNCIEAIINNSHQTEICTPTDNTKYRLRDAHWYSNNYPKDNFVYSSFNRFNFFNTDAANDLAKSNNEDDVKLALSNIILGSEFNYIFERINGFYDRIKPVYNDLDRAIRNATQTIRDVEQLISKLGKSETLNALIVIVNGNIQSLHFKNKDLNPEKGYAEIEVLINQLKSITEKALQPQGISINSRNDLTDTKKEFSIKEAAFNEFQKNLEKVSQDISLQEQEISILTAKSNLLTSATKYFGDPRLFEIKGFNKRFADTEELIRKVQAMTRNLGTIDLQAFSSEENINVLLDKTRTNLVIAKSTLDESEAELKKLLAQFNNTDKIINEIKLLGKEYLTLAPDATSCPLCLSNYERSELERRIQEILKTNSKENQERIDLLHQKQQAAKDTVDKLTQFLNSLINLKTAYDNTFSGDSSGISVAQIVREISRFKDDESIYIQQKQELIGFRQIAESLNITEEEFSYLSSKLITEIGSEFILGFDNKKLFEEKAAQFSEDIKKLKENLIKLQDQRFKLSADFKKAIGFEEEKSYTLNEYNSMLETEKRNINLLESFLTQIDQIIDLKDKDLLSEIDLQVSVLQKNIASLKTEQQNQYELNRAEKEKQQAQVSLENNQKKFDRIKLAFDTLHFLRQSDGTQQLNTFFENNLNEIIDIFKTIHAPREFKSLVFQNKQLFLVKENDQKRKITEISTGQRSALALSIFISINRQLKNGPNLMIFDDPVSHIDDLNALSFLDFLRFFILKEDRQIFFATASTRLASLFEKKFEFLETDFQKWELKR